MIIRQMRANFGKLRGATLDLRPGMNLLCLPNETGKSTWSAFLLAMLYGVNTREQSRKSGGVLPDKERYKPWDGSAMSGAIDLVWNGRSITIERRSKRAPLNQFSAYDTDSGAPIPELTAENCGLLLCGVERSVFERTAFIRQLGLGVGKDDALEARLNALVSTGEEGLSATQLLAELNNLHNRLARTSTGRIPRRTAELDQKKRQLAELRALQDEIFRLTARRADAAAELARLDALAAQAEAAETAKKRAGLVRMEAEADAQEALCGRLRADAEGLPEEETLQALQRELDAAERSLSTARMDAAFAAADPPEPQAPACFAGMRGEEAVQAVRADQKAAEALAAQTAPKRPAALYALMALAAVLAVAAAVLLPAARLLAPLAGVLLEAGLLTVILVRKSREAQAERRRLERLAALPNKYGVDDLAQAVTLAERFAADRRAYEADCAERQRERKRLADRAAQAQAALDAVLERVPAAHADAADCRTWLGDALQARRRLATEQRALEHLKAQLASLRAVLGELPQTDAAVPAEPVDTARLAYERRNAAALLERLERELSHSTGACSMLGDAVELEAEIGRLAEENARDTAAVAAIELAQRAVETADNELRAQFSPQLAREAGTILAELTGGKYAAMLLEPDMSLSVREAGGTVMHRANAMSCGTSDQMYLALRLAMSRRLLPPDAPLILDDALVNFDDARAAAALALLRREAGTRQIILFTCRNFEERDA